MSNALPTSNAGQVFKSRSGSKLVIGFALDRVAIWIATITAIVLVYQFSESLPLAAATMLVLVLGRATVVVLARNVAIAEPVAQLASIVRIGAVAGLILFQSQNHIWWALVLLGVIGVASGIIEIAYASLLPNIGERRHLPMMNRALSRSEQISSVAGPLLAAALVFVLDGRSAFAVAAAILYASLVLLRRLHVEHRESATTLDRPAWSDNPFTVEMRGIPSEVKMVMTGLVALAALGVIIRIALLDLLVGHIGYSGAVYAGLLALVGIGALLGPLPVDRLLGHFPIGLILTGGVVGVASVLAIVGLRGPILIVVPALFAIGFTMATLDSAAAVSVRRSVPERNARDVSQVFAQALLIGQAGALLLVMFVSSTWSSTVASLGLAVLCVVAVGVHFLQAGRVKTHRAAARSEADRVAPNESAAGQT